MRCAPRWKLRLWGVEKIKFLPFRPPDQVPYVLAAGDLHLITIKHGLEGVVVPSKLYSTLAAGRPILVLAPEGSDAARVVRRLGCGVVIDPNDAAGMAAIVKELAHDPKRIAQMGKQAFQAAGEFARDKELQQFRTVVEGAI